ncbi:MAG TPA: 8-amino-7-oxononanoate synthase [Burkholderiaceae bacterium]
MPLIASLQKELQQLDARALRRRRRVTDTPCAPRVQVDGRPMLAFCSNDYLGLAAHPRMVEALREGATLYGVGSGAAHLVSGHSRAHALLEDRLADFLSPHLESARALYFCTGYMANLAMLTALTVQDGTEATIFSEAVNHASLIDGARLSKAKVQIYPHGDTAALENYLKASTAKTKVVVTDSVFSMDGDLAPVPALLKLCEQYGAWLVVDDAHGFGVLGKHGRGVLEHFALRSPYLIYMGTLGKAAGVGGAFVAAHETVIDWLVQRARPYIYTTAAAPALAHALLTSIDIISSNEGNQRRAHLQALIKQLQTEWRLQKWQCPHSETAIQPVIIGTNEAALRVAAALYDQGMWVPAIRPPTVPEGTARLRVTLSAAHTKEDVTQLTTALNSLETTLK